MTPSTQPVSGHASPAPPSGDGQECPSGSETGVRARRRLANKMLQSLKDNRSTFISDKEGIKITSDHDTSENISDGKIKFDVERTREIYVVKIFVCNTGTQALYFCYYTALHWMRCFSLFDEKKVTRVNPLLLHPGEKYEVQVRFRAQYFGSFPATLAFEFKHNFSAKSTRFHIVRYVEAMCGTSVALELAPTCPYKPTRVIRQMVMVSQVEEGEPPESHVVHRLERVLPLDKYKYPPYLKDLPMFLKGYSFRNSAELQSMKSRLECPLSFQNYAKRFQLLLHLEEIQMEFDIKKYDMHNAPMVPGVAENRPSVLRGDHILVSRVGDTEPVTKYKGYVHRVELESVLLGFSQKLLDSFIDNMTFNVEFTINRYPMMLQHRAVALAVQNHLEEVLFPTGCRGGNLPLPSLRLFDRKLEQNPEQCTAVQRIVVGTSKPAPYLVFGPPGTGKTVTIVEAVKQVHKANPSAHILACAPSNSAADLLCERILLNGIQGCCNWNEREGAFVFPSKQTLMEYKVLVTTVVTAGRLVCGGLPRDHFTHIFVDEAGHAVEPECIIGLSGLLQGETGQLVLAGDPQQLGPILRSPLAIEHGLGLSLLERLMKHNRLYKKDGETGLYDNRFVTKLLRNYSSDSALHLLMSARVSTGGFPVIFHGVAGKDERESNSPSFFNRNEIDIIVQKIRKAITSVDKDLKSLKGIDQLKVGSVEEFQGQERKRFNVALTRAKALLIVVGNPLILNQDPTWGKFIKYCTEETGYKGFDYAEEEGEEDVMARLASLCIKEEEEVETEESAVQQHMDPEWRNEQ
ncbi:hypothetical protein JZ751_010210 [Albula glossodonta]|uniref:RNA helicase n=1 Tax=Albula glossodonta TaxID=121402 RepID=A0A8T2NB80_9TELE|nr:hypothetical protein JZ751_010210 [Albula glossodonta]